MNREDKTKELIEKRENINKTRVDKNTEIFKEYFIKNKESIIRCFEEGDSFYYAKFENAYEVYSSIVYGNNKPSEIINEILGADIIKTTGHCMGSLVLTYI